MTRYVTTGALVLVLLGLAAVPAPASAQQRGPGVDVTAPPPARPTPEFGLEPTLPPEQRGSREQEFYPGAVRSRHEPAFVTPFVTTVPVSQSSAVRAGLSGWTAPAVPFDIPQSTGGVAFGFTLVWELPVRGADAPLTAGPEQR